MTESYDYDEYGNRRTPTGALNCVERCMHTAKFRLNAQSLYDCFHTVDGVNVFEALVDLCDVGLARRLPILFQ